jgi:hypothetical protein
MARVIGRNKEKRRAVTAKYRDSHKEEIKVAAAEYRDSHKEERHAYYVALQGSVSISDAGRIRFAGISV